MCFGRYGKNENKPRITGTVIVPDGGLGQEIDFLIDTGADESVIGGTDAIKLGLTPQDVGDELEFNTTESQGIGGMTETHEVNELVLFAFQEYSDDLEKFSLHIEFVDGIDVVPRCPTSLLGRDLLDRFDVEFRQSEGVVEMVRHNYGEGAYMCIGIDKEGSPPPPLVDVNQNGELKDSDETVDGNGSK